jgi:predicted nucleotidyltransferase
MDGPFTPATCRAARALLDMSQSALAKEAGVSRLTVIGFEDGSRRVMAANLKALRSALEEAGVEFVPGGARIGDGSALPDSSGRGTEQRLAAVLRSLQRAAKRLHELGVRHAVVFGSVAHGEAGPRSRVDIAIDIDESRVKDGPGVSGIVAEIEDLMGPHVQVVRSGHLRASVARAVRREGIRAF